VSFGDRTAPTHAAGGEEATEVVSRGAGAPLPEATTHWMQVLPFAVPLVMVVAVAGMTVLRFAAARKRAHRYFQAAYRVAHDRTEASDAPANDRELARDVWTGPMVAVLGAWAHVRAGDPAGALQRLDAAPSKGPWQPALAEHWARAVAPRRALRALVLMLGGDVAGANLELAVAAQTCTSSRIASLVHATTLVGCTRVGALDRAHDLLAGHAGTSGRTYEVEFLESLVRARCGDVAIADELRRELARHPESLPFLRLAARELVTATTS
jgi:hypothetical protein